MYTKQKISKNELKGKRYEGFIAWLLTKEGWEVQPRGKYGVYDRGIDLIATKNGVTRYVQCKGWNFKRYIHENVVNQFYGSVVSQVGAENLSNVEMYIYSTARPSQYANDLAKRLNVHFVRQGFRFWSRKKRG